MHHGLIKIFKIFIAVSAFLMLAFLGFLLYFLDFIADKGNIDLFWFYILLAYIVCSGFVFYISFESKNKIITSICNIILAPIYFVFLIFMIIYPLVLILLHYILAMLIGLAIPSLIIYLLRYFEVITITPELKLYFTLTTAVFLVVLFNKYFKKLTNYTLKKLGKKVYIENSLFDKIVNNNNEKFAIYTLYLGLLIFVNIFKLQEKAFLINTNFDTAVLQSLVTFIAFDKVHSSYKQLNFNPLQTVLLYISDVRSFISKEKKNDPS